jgi:ATP/maltotriose-dependent transcriptional regulator MalT
MSLLNTLTQRERDVLILIAGGQHNKEACALGIAIHTVEQHLKHIYQKLEIENRTEAAMLYWTQDVKFQT